MRTNTEIRVQRSMVRRMKGTGGAAARDAGKSDEGAANSLIPEDVRRRDESPSLQDGRGGDRDHEVLTQYADTGPIKTVSLPCTRGTMGTLLRAGMQRTMMFHEYRVRVMRDKLGRLQLAPKVEGGVA